MAAYAIICKTRKSICYVGMVCARTDKSNQ